MRIISVTGAGSGAGKTSLVVRLLETFPGTLTALKFSHPHGGLEPGSPFRVIEDPAVLGDPAKDTGRFLAAGARRVLWCLASQGSESEAWSHLEEDHLSPDEIIIAEGNRVAEIARPDLLIFVVNPERPPEEWKRGIEPLAHRADVVVWNAKTQGATQAAAEFERLFGEGGKPPRIFCGDLRRPLRQAIPELETVVAKAAGLSSDPRAARP